MCSSSSSSNSVCPTPQQRLLRTLWQFLSISLETCKEFSQETKNWRCVHVSLCLCVSLFVCVSLFLSHFLFLCVSVGQRVKKHFWLHQNSQFQIFFFNFKKFLFSSIWKHNSQYFIIRLCHKKISWVTSNINYIYVCVYTYHIYIYIYI